jgi:hypothetical protein
VPDDPICLGYLSGGMVKLTPVLLEQGIVMFIYGSIIQFHLPYNLQNFFTEF